MTKHLKRGYTLKELIEARSIPIPEAGCWIWIGAMSDTGYGSLSFHGRKMNAHRAAYLAYKGKIPHGNDVCHRCDVRICVNPNHLFIGSRSDNMQDWISKTGGHRGERSHFAKLTAQQVLAIRADRRCPREIAHSFGIHIAHVYALKRRDWWAHL
jgi:hypothetical protein